MTAARWYPIAALATHDLHPTALGVLELDDPPLELEVRRTAYGVVGLWRDELGEVVGIAIAASG